MIATKRTTSRNNWGTPWPWFWELEYRYGRGEYTLDVCAEPWSAKCPNYYTIEENGLISPWVGRVWCNPPFENIYPWLARAIEMIGSTPELELVTMLLPHRSDQAWYHDIVVPHATFKIEPLGRVHYDPPPGFKAKSKGKKGKGTSPFEATLVAQFEQPLYAPSYRTAA